MDSILSPVQTMSRKDSCVHDLANQRTVSAAMKSSVKVKASITTTKRTFCLAIFTEEWWVANNAIERPLKFGWQLNCLLEIVPHKFFKHSEAFIVLE